MPIHDWTRVPAGLFHHFHQDWTIEIARTLNRGRLPRGVAALVEQRAGPREADVLAIERRGNPRPTATDGGVAVREPPAAPIIRRNARFMYAERANRIVIKHHLGQILAVIEILSPGTKDGRGTMRRFIENKITLLREGKRFLIVDLFPATPRDPFGIHKVLWDEIVDEDFVFPPGKDRILASYTTGLEDVAYVEPVAVGDRMPDMPLFLAEELHITVPLESTYQATWDASPEEMRVAV